MLRAEKSWGQVLINQAEDGSIQVVFENDSLFCQYGLMDCDSEEVFESPIRRFVLKPLGEDQVQAPGGDRDSRLDAAAGRGCLARASIFHHTEDSITAYLEWIPIKGRKASQNVTIFNNKPWIQIEYLDWDVNIVDIAHPGATPHGQYHFWGAETWKRSFVYYEDIYFCKYAGDVGYRNITEVDDPAPLLYEDNFIMGIFNPETGRGYGRVMPAEPIDIIKLLFKDRHCGFELFPYYQRKHHVFRGYLFLVTGGKDGVISIGKQIINDMRTLL